MVRFGAVKMLAFWGGVFFRPAKGASKNLAVQPGEVFNVGLFVDLIKVLKDCFVWVFFPKPEK